MGKASEQPWFDELCWRILEGYTYEQVRDWCQEHHAYSLSVYSFRRIRRKYERQRQPGFHERVVQKALDQLNEEGGKVTITEAQRSLSCLADSKAGSHSVLNHATLVKYLREEVYGL